MSGGCDTTPEERARWDAETADRERERARQEAIAWEQTNAASVKEIERVAALLPPEESSAKRYLMGFAAGLRHRGR